MYWDDPLMQVVVQLTEVPEKGDARVLIRFTHEDRNMITRAARSIELSQSKFMRVVLVNAAKKVLEEMGEA